MEGIEGDARACGARESGRARLRRRSPDRKLSYVECLEDVGKGDPDDACGEDAGDEFEAFNMHLAPTYDSDRITRHTVRRGDTLGGLARRYHVSIEKLKQWNGPLKVIRIGQVIVVAQAAARSSPGNRPHKVAQTNSASKGI